MQLNAATLTAAPTQAGTDLLSLIPTQDAASAASTNVSAPIAQDFSALLTEMMGPVDAPALTQLQAVPQISQVAQLPQVLQLAQPSLPTQPGLPVQPSLTTQSGLPVQQSPSTQSGLPVRTGLPAQPVQSGLPVPLALPVQPGLPVQPEAPAQPSTPEPAVPTAELPTLPEITVGQPTAKEAPKAQEAQKALPLDNVVVPFVPLVVMSPVVTSEEPAGCPAEKIDKSTVAQLPAPAELAVAPRSDVERAFADLKSFEVTVQNEIAKPAEGHSLQSQPASAASEDSTRQALVTTDPIANIQQQQLPPRVMPIPRITIEVKTPERGKADSLVSSNDTTATSTATGHFTDLIRPVEQPDQVLAAHHVEIPNMPHLQVVRNVAMEVGDPGSQVTIRLQERGGDVTLQFNTGNEPLRQDLQSSVDSLVHALKLDHVQVSNVEVSRKSPIDKVRRMKEAH